MAWNHGLSHAVLGMYAGALMDLYRRRAIEGGIHGGRTGFVTVMQRAGSGLNINLHFPPPALAGVSSADESADGRAFHPAPAPSDAEVAETLATIRHRVRRLLMRRGLETSETSSGPADPLAEESPVLAGIGSAPGPRGLPPGARRGGPGRPPGAGPPRPPARLPRPPPPPPGRLHLPA